MRSLINNSLPAWLFIFCIIVFASGLGGDFVMDDWPVIKENSKITDIKNIPDYFTRSFLFNTDLAEETKPEDPGLYRPVFLLTLNLAHQLWGDSALGYHALNLILHSTNTILVYFLILGFLSPAWRMIAGMSAALFAVHPVHVESVAWISGMSDPLVSLFLLGGFLLHRHWHQTTSRQKKLIYAASAPLCFALALLTKETAIFFPLILIIYDALFHRNTLYSKSGIARYLTYAVLLLIYFVLRNNALDASDIQQTNIWARINFQNFPVLLAFFTHYIQLLVFPSSLEYYYSPPVTGMFTLVTGSLFFIGALFYLPRALRQQHGLYVLAIAWIVITLLPALPLSLFDEPVFAQRVLYLPSAGFAMFIAWAIRQAQQHSHTIGAIVKTIAIVFLIFFSVTSMTGIATWKNDTVFYTRAMKTSPDSFKPVAGLAAAYARNTTQNNEAIIDLYLKAARLAPREIDKIEFQKNAARIYEQSGKISESEQLYHDIVRRAPKHASAWIGLGNNALARKHQQQALAFYQKAYEADPNNRIASYNLALIYQQLGKPERAAFFRDLAQDLSATQ